jgi:hypothetical protein
MFATIPDFLEGGETTREKKQLQRGVVSDCRGKGFPHKAINETSKS